MLGVVSTPRCTANIKGLVPRKRQVVTKTGFAIKRLVPRLIEVGGKSRLGVYSTWIGRRQNPECTLPEFQTSRKSSVCPTEPQKVRGVPCPASHSSLAIA
jgi:hypothetical protein